MSIAGSSASDLSPQERRELRGRWLFVALGFLVNLCEGGIYAFSVFRKPLEERLSIGATASGLPFTVFLAVFAVTMAVSGGLLERWGPRKTGILGGILVGLGWVLAGLWPNVALLVLFYGVLSGAGVGLLYGAPIAVVTRWFPDRKGLAVGLTLMGFGLSALVIAPVLSTLINSVGPLRTFTYLGLVFLAVLPVLAAPLRYPRPGWRPPGWVPANGHSSLGPDLDRKAMLRTRTFYVLWLTFTFGSMAGLMAVGIAAPFGKEVAGLSPRMAALAVSAFAMFNGLGRPLFGWLADRITPRYAAILSFALILAAAVALDVGGKGHPALYFLAFAVFWLNLGGWLAIAPTATAIFFGAKDYGRNYGLTFTAYGAGGILAGTISGLVRDLTGSYLAVFFPVMGLACAGLVLAVWGLRPPQEPQATVAHGPSPTVTKARI